MSTLSQLIVKVQNRLSMVAGTGVQIYAEDVIADMIQHKFDVLFDEAWWPQFTTFQTFTLDGTNGQVTTDVTNLIKRFDDIRIIYRAGGNTPITKLSPTSTNPFELAGTTPIHYDSDTAVDKVFHVWPKTSTGNIVVQYRTKPADFTSEDTINFDDQALVLGSVYDFAEDDGTNPNATQKFQNLFETRVKQLKNNLNSAPISLDPVTSLPTSFSFVELP
jgi:hypothetical protein